MAERLDVRLDDERTEALDRVCAATGKAREEVVGKALRRALLLAEFDLLQDELRPYGEAKGWRTDEDVFQALS